MLDKHKSRLYKLENLNIPHQVSKAVDEIVTDVVDWAMQAPLRARFRDLPTKSMELDYSNQRLADKEEAHKKKRKTRESLRTPLGSTPTQPPPPPPPAGASGTLATRQSSSKFSKIAASASQSMSWTTSDTQYESADIPGAQELSPTDYLIQDDSIPEEQVLLSDDEDSENDHQPKADSPLSHVTIQPQFFFNKDLEYLRYGSKPALSISKMKAASYPDFGVELLVPEQMWIDDVCTYDISAKYGISHCYSRYGYDYLSEIVLRRADFQDYTIAKKDFKNLGVETFQLDMKLLVTVEPYKNQDGTANRLQSDGTLTRILEALDYRVKEFKVKRLNPGMNTRFWTKKDVTRSKEFIAAIERQPKTRRIYQNLECFVGGRVLDIDYRLLQRTE
ncbi:hypothetical protein Tco_0099781 [Tanacetum coccineum]